MKRVNVKEFCLSLLAKFALKCFQVCTLQDIYLKGRRRKTIDLSEKSIKKYHFSARCNRKEDKTDNNTFEAEYHLGWWKRCADSMHRLVGWGQAVGIVSNKNTYILVLLKHRFITNETVHHCFSWFFNLWIWSYRTLKNHVGSAAIHTKRAEVSISEKFQFFPL